MGAVTRLSSKRNRKDGKASARARRGRLNEAYGERLGEAMFREQMGQKRKGRIGRRWPSRRRTLALPVNPPAGILAAKLAEALAASAARPARPTGVSPSAPTAKTRARYLERSWRH